MNNYFTVKVKYTKQLENGTFKKVSEPYLVEAQSFTDAEAVIYEALGSIIRGEFNVMSITRTEIHDIRYYDANVWYKCKVAHESKDSESGKSKKVYQIFLVSADSVKEANEVLNDELSASLADYQIKSVVETTIVDIFYTGITQPEFEDQ